jgi:hypothetical protein
MIPRIGYLIGYIVNWPDLEHFMETCQIEDTDFSAGRLFRINKWIRAQKAKPSVPTLCCAMVDGNATGFVLTKYLLTLPENGHVPETERDKELRGRFAKAGDLEGQSSSWQFTVIPNY